MKIANLNGRATVVTDAGGVDVAQASDGRFGPDVQAIFGEWREFLELAPNLATASATPIDESLLGPPVPRPPQVFAIGLNYRAHAEESGMDIPAVPATFTKFPASITGPFADVEIPAPTTDWEVELVAEIGIEADRVTEADAWSHIAGVTVGQDISERTLQFAAAGQFSLGKSYRGFSPIGPWIVTLDELADPDDLALGCSVDGETMQSSRTSDLIFNVPQLVAELSAVLPLWPGDIIFTGTPSGVGVTRKPARFLQPGEILETWIEGIGTMRNRMIAAPDR
jgi:2,4-diketo-3-deoxy-L-fuconate hydrolase